MKHGLFAELKRRHVYRVAVAYAVVGWLLIEVATQVFPFFHVPNWSIRLLVLLVVAGFPVAVILAWAFEMTPDGVRRTEPPDSPETRAPEQGRKVGHTLDRVIIGVLVVAVAFMAWRMWTPHKKASEPPAIVAATSSKTPAKASAAASATSAIPAKSIAVLPFENLSSDKNNAYFADGMQDLILTKLADIGDLKVISRTSTLQYGSHPQNLTKVGKALGVATLLEGSVQKAGDQVLVNVQLIDARTDAHLWANSYQRTLKNVFGVEGEVAEKIASALNAKLSPSETSSLATGLSDDSEANLLYLRAQHESDASHSNDPYKATEGAIGLYRQAVSRVPDFALARAELSMTESWLTFIGGGNEDAGKLRADARAQAEQALKLAPSLPESHLAMGFVAYYGSSDYDAALQSFAAALRLRPNDADAYEARGFVLNDQGKFGLAIASLRKAWTLDPNSGGIPLSIGISYMAQGNYGQAKTIMRNALVLHPNNNILRYWYARCIMLATGNLDRALAEVQGPGEALALIRTKFLIYQREYDQAIALYKTLSDSLLTVSDNGKDVAMAIAYQMTGDITRARTYATRALPRLQARLKAQAGNPMPVWRTLGAMARAQEILGKTQDAMASIKAMLAAGEASANPSYRAWVVLTAAVDYASAGRADQAIPLLSRALTMPGIGPRYSPVMLWIDPDLDPIRKTPAFQALLKKYTRYKPPLKRYPAPSTSSTGA